MNNFNESQVINGNEGELWLDGEKMAETTKCEGMINFNYVDVPINKKFLLGRKCTGGTTDGAVTLHKVTSAFMIKMHEYVKQNKTPVFDLISKVSDPDALGTERVGFYGCTFDKMILAQWENGQLGKEDYKFRFTEYELFDTIK